MLWLDTAKMSVLDHPVVVRPWRPPTAVYPDRHQIARARNEDFPPTALGGEHVFMINLEGAFLSPGALVEMIVPLAQAIRNGTYGPTALLVVTSDESTLEFLEALAVRHDLSMFISSSAEKPLSEARPIGTLTATEIETLSLVRRSGGAVTSSRVADLAGIEPNAAVNRVTGLVRKGYLHRVTRPRTEGDAFVDLVSIAETTPAAVSARSAVPTSQRNFSIPEDVRDGVLLLAEMQGSKPADVLAHVWREFLSRHRELLDTDSKEVGRMVREGDTAGLAAYASRYARERAKQAVSRTKRQLP
jgi:DNA-binding MarR family transcriptional regulator